MDRTGEQPARRKVVGQSSEGPCRLTTFSCGPTVFVEAVVAVPEHRREGVATQILRRILDDAEASGCDKVQVLSHKPHADDGGHAFYENNGFTAEAEGFRLYLRTGRAQQRA